MKYGTLGELQRGMNIKVGIIGFNEIDALKTLIPSLKKAKVPTEDIVFFDGPFVEFKHDKDYSTDGTLEYLKQEGIKIEPCGEMTPLQNYHEIHECYQLICFASYQPLFF